MKKGLSLLSGALLSLSMFSGLGLTAGVAVASDVPDISADIKVDGADIELEDACVTANLGHGLDVKVLGHMFHVHVVEGTEITTADGEVADLSGFMAGDLVDIKGTLSDMKPHFILADEIEMEDVDLEELDEPEELEIEDVDEDNSGEGNVEGA